jgi:[acyl-carrier-protein] S-malonyltransferase
MPQPIALMFPGQGAQTVGMGVALAERFAVVERWFASAEEAAEFPLRRLLREGPEDQLRLTEFLQPALLAVEIGAWFAWRELVERPPAAALGHSLGEYAALVAADALAPEAAVRLARRRGRYMQEAVPPGLGGMSAVTELPAERVAALCEEASDAAAQVWLSNDNCPGQVVVSGHLAAIDRATPLLKAAGARRIVPLKVSAPFHCPLMQPAAARLAAELATIDFGAPRFPVIANWNAAPYAAAAGVADGLLRQVTQPVRFRESLLSLPAFHGVAGVELGPGTVLSGLGRRTLPEWRFYQADEPAKLAAVVQESA